jgi:hypothetical protein
MYDFEDGKNSKKLRQSPNIDLIIPSGSEQINPIGY